jgi:hypothetical protein
LTFHDTTLPSPGIYFYRVQAVNADGNSGFSNTTFAGAGLGAYATSVPHSDGFANHADMLANGTATFVGSGQNPIGILTGQQDVGVPGNPATLGTGTFNSSNSSYTLTASGSDIWDTADHMHYAYRPLIGDGEIVARVVSETNGDYWVKAGLMIRANLSAGAANAFMFETPHATPGGDHDEPVFQWRDTQGGGSADFGNHNGPIQQAPVWLRLVKSGQNFSGYWAQDINNGQSHGAWNQIGGVHTVPGLGSTSYIGLGLTAHNNSQVATAVFDHLTVSNLSPVPLELVDGATGEAGSAFTVNKVPTNFFNTSFILQQSPTIGAADALCFVLQNDPRGSSALGGSGGASGYSGIVNSICIKFDLYTHNSHHSSTGLFTGGQSPDGNPGNDIDLTPYGINLASGDPMLVNMSYNGVSLVERITDTVNGNSFTKSYTLNLAATLGGTKAYAGFTAGTGGEAAIMTVNSWTGDFLPSGLPAFTVSGYPSPATAGDPHSLTVTVKFPDGTTVSDYTGTVHFTSTDPQAVLPADYHFVAADAGTHTFPNVVLKTAGTQSITATDTANSFIVGAQTGIVVNPAAASVLTVAGFPSTTAGDPHTFTVTAKDAYNNVATGYTGTVHVSSSDPHPADLPGDYTFTGADAGTHTFTGTLFTAGTQSITAADAAHNLSGTQSGIMVTPAAPSSFHVFGYPTTVTAGTANLFTVEVTDAYGNHSSNYIGTVHFSSSDTRALLPADYMFTAQDNGTHVFGAVLDTAGVQSITSTDTANQFSGTLSGINVNPAGFRVSGFPSSITAGDQGNFTVEVLDVQGSTIPGYTGTVHFTSSDPQAQLPGDYTFTLDDNGVHSFSAALLTSGTQSITATDTVTTSIKGTQAGIVVNAATASSLTVSGFPSPQTAGVAGNVTVTAKDIYGNVATGYTGTVHFKSDDARAQLPPDYAFVADDNGVHTFSATLVTAGTHSITAGDKLNHFAGSQTGIVIVPAAAASLVVNGYPSPVTAGTVNTFRVTAYDAFQNVATAYTGTIHFSSSDPQANLPADYKFIASDQGTQTFAAVLNTVGTQSITATDTVNQTITGTQSDIQVVAPTLPVGGASSNGVLPADNTTGAVSGTTVQTQTTPVDTSSATVNAAATAPAPSLAPQAVDSVFADLGTGLLDNQALGTV